MQITGCVSQAPRTFLQIEQISSRNARDIDVSLIELPLIVGEVPIAMATRTRTQAQVFGQLHEREITCRLMDPPRCLRFLPKRILDAGGGHWCRYIDSVRLEVRLSDQEDLLNFKKNIDLIGQLTYLNNLSLDFWDPVSDKAALKDALRSLANLGTLNSLELNVEPDLASILEAMPLLPKLRRLYTISSSDMTDNDLVLFKKFPDLETLFQGSRVLVDHLAPLAALPKLETLYIDVTHPNTSFESFRGHATLRSFSTQSDLTDEIIEILASCPNMESIDGGSDSTITDSGLAPLKKLTHLRALTLSGPSLTDKGFSQLADCKMLSSLTLRECNLTDAIGPTLEKLTNLESFFASQTQVTDNLLSHLANLKNLILVDLGEKKIDINKAWQLSHLPELPSGFCTSTRFQELRYRLGDDGTTAPPPLADRLCFENLRGLRGQISRIRGLPQLDRVHLSNTDIEDSDVQALLANSQLCELDISKTCVTSAGLAALPNQAKLKALILGPFEDQTSAVKMLSPLTWLESLRLTTTGKLDEQSVASLCDLTSLERLELLSHAYDEIICKQLARALPKLRSVSWFRYVSYM